MQKYRNTLNIPLLHRIYLLLMSKKVKEFCAGLPETVWAAAVPANYDRRICDVIEDIYGDHMFLVSNTIFLVITSSQSCADKKPPEKRTNLTFQDCARYPCKICFSQKLYPKLHLLKANSDYSSRHRD